MRPFLPNTVLTICSGAILACFVLSITGGVQWAVCALPLSGLFMSVIYPTVNSKGISCMPKSEPGAAAGVILFYTCLSAVLAPLAIGAILGHADETEYQPPASNISST